MFHDEKLQLLAKSIVRQRKYAGDDYWGVCEVTDIAVRRENLTQGQSQAVRDYVRILWGEE